MEMVAVHQPNHTDAMPHRGSPSPSRGHSPAKPKEKSTRLPISVGLGVALIMGTLSIVFLLVFGLRPKLFSPTKKNLHRNMVPIVHQGNFAVYPPYVENSDSNDSYVFRLPPARMEETVKYLEDIANSYPNDWSSQYTDCWLEKPSYDRPCLYHREWIGSNCSDSTDYGYREIDGKFNPCIIVRLEETEDWKPKPERKDELPKGVMRYFDSEFVQVYCYPKNPSDRKKINSITTYPQKGFSLQYFPASNFNPDLYLQPAVAIQVAGIEKGQNVTVECGLLATNTLQLWSGGKILLRFVSE